MLTDWWVLRVFGLPVEQCWMHGVQRTLIANIIQHSRIAGYCKYWFRTATLNTCNSKCPLTVHVQEILIYIIQQYSTWFSRMAKHVEKPVWPPRLTSYNCTESCWICLTEAGPIKHDNKTNTRALQQLYLKIIMYQRNLLIYCQTGCPAERHFAILSRNVDV